MVVLSKIAKRFRIATEESFKHERPEVRNPDRRWYLIIPCQGFKPGPPQEGPFIGLYSEDPPTLQLYTPRVQNAKTIWTQIKDYSGCRADFHLEGEAVLYFPPEVLPQVADLAGARKKRTLSEAHKAKLAEASQKFRFKSKNYGSKTQNPSQFEAQTLPPGQMEGGEELSV